MKGRVVVCKEYGEPFVIEEYDVPEPVPGAVILRMTQACVFGSDLHTWRGDQNNRELPLPPTGRAMGHEGTGVVEILGDGVETDSAGAPIKKGDRVIIYMPMIPEAVIAMLGCARIGAIHSVVFGGFAANELAS